MEFSGIVGVKTHVVLLKGRKLISFYQCFCFCFLVCNKSELVKWQEKYFHKLLHPVRLIVKYFAEVRVKYSPFIFMYTLNLIMNAWDNFVEQFSYSIVYSCISRCYKYIFVACMNLKTINANTRSSRKRKEKKNINDVNKERGKFIMHIKEKCYTEVTIRIWISKQENALMMQHTDWRQKLGE